MNSNCTKQGDRKWKHGESYTRLHRIWDNMKARCYRETSDDYPRYGKRGITVCDEWKDDYAAFSKWAHDNGYCENLTLDRIDNMRGYSPDNCRWVDRKVQANNTRTSTKYLFNNQYHTLAEWSEIVHIPKTTLWNRIKMYGWSIERALTEPVATKRNNVSLIQ